MSDYIRKQDVIDLINGLDSLPWEEETKEIVDGLPTLDEKEIIRKTVERIVERVENARQKYQRLVKEQGEKEDEAINILFRGMLNIVKEEGGIE